MKHILRILIPGLALFACENESTQIGANFFKDGALDISILDTVTVKLATVKYEELITNKSSRLLIGHHNDEALGAVSSSAYFELSAPGVTALTQYNSSYNYLALILKYDGYSFYDTTLTNTFHVRRVFQEMEEDDDGYLYNHSSFVLQPGRLGSHTFAARPHGDSIAIKLDDQLGIELYNKLLARADETSNQNDFSNYFSGLAVLPDNTVNGSLVGFTAAADLRLYYVDKSQVPNNRDAYISFPLNSESGTYFNNISSDTRNTPLDGKLADEDDRLDAAQTNHNAYIQGGTGLALRVDFPYIKSLNGLKNFYITNATLKIHPSHGSYNDFMPLPDALNSFVVYPDNSTYAVFASGIPLATESELPRDSYYSVDVTSLIQSLISEMGDKDDQHGLLLQLEDSQYRASVSRLFAGTTKTNLTIYFATIKNN